LLLIIENDPTVPPGTLLGVLEEACVPYRIVRTWQGDPLPAVPGEGAAPGGAVVLGGRMGARDGREHPFIEDVRRFSLEAAERNFPLLGICLGGQILADVLGGDLHSRHQGESGVRTLRLTSRGCFDPLFHNVPYEFVTFQWHNDSFSLPEFAVHLATGEICRNQAFCFGRSAYGVQFHPEVDREIVAAWAEEDGRQDLLAPFDAAAEEYLRAGRTIFRNFLRIAKLIA
jgi:GMP synthase-like glutamine amidotransferase